jgi:phosphate-selective porin OprO and OprP
VHVRQSAWRRIYIAALALVFASQRLAAAELPGDSLACQLPAQCTFAGGMQIGLNLTYQFDSDNFSNDDHTFTDSSTNRRKQLGVFLRKPNVFDIAATYDFQARAWQDVYARVQSKAIVKSDIGAFRLGFTKVPVGLENLTSSSATSFIESSLPTEALQESRRVGADWALQRPHVIVDAGYYFKGGPKPGYGYYFNGYPATNGKTAAARVVWLPWNISHEVLHFAISAAQESPASNVGEFGIDKPAIQVIRTRPEADLTTVRLVNSGDIPFVEHIDRLGLEQLWISGPWSIQSEYLQARLERLYGLNTYSTNGYYIFGSYVLTGESRGYANGSPGDVRAGRPFGAVEVLIRYSSVDLDDAPILGGREHDWTAGLNWYVNKYFKFQTNLIHATSERQGKSIDPNIVEVRLQLTL